MARPAEGRRIEVEGVDVAYGTGAAVVSNVSITVEPGSTLVLLGPSGCGKTTLLRAIAGLERPTRGSIRLGSDVVSDAHTWLAPERRGVGMVFQDSALFPHLTVGDNVAFGLRSLGRADRLARVSELLDLVGLADCAERRPGTLSGGQQQRVAFARSLAPNPGVLLLDEPFSALDAALRAQLRLDVARIVREIGVTTVFVTHDQDEAFVVGDNVAVMRAGRLHQMGTPEELYRRPTDPWVARFVGEANVLLGRRTGTTAMTSIGAVTLEDEAPATEVVHVLVRPEEICVQRGGPDTVVHVQFFGHDARVDVRQSDGSVVLARCRSIEPIGLGDAVSLRHAGGPAVAWASDEPGGAGGAVG